MSEKLVTPGKVSEIDNHINRQYNVVRRLGKGAYGIVWKAIERKTQATVAVKKIFDAFRNQTDAQRTFREIMFLLSFANHENVIRLYGLHKADNNRDIYLVFEYMETDLHNVIKRGNILKDIHKIFIMYQLFKAIKYIHSGNVIHRDLKPSNVLLNERCHCKIADFGLARSVTQIGQGDGQNGIDPALTDYVATRWYRAPEILIASKRYTKGIDMWSLGCILGEMLLGKPIFPGSSTINQIEIIMATLPPPTSEDLMSVSAGYGTNLLEKAPSVPKRKLKDLLPEISDKALDLIDNLILFNPTRRLTAVQALKHPYVADFHRRGNEPERSSSVVLLLRDDVQLSVDEYRNKLYAMMDAKYRRERIHSKSKIKIDSEGISKLRRPTANSGKTYSTVLEQSMIKNNKKKGNNGKERDTRKQHNNIVYDDPIQRLCKSQRSIVSEKLTSTTAVSKYRPTMKIIDQDNDYFIRSRTSNTVKNYLNQTVPSEFSINSNKWRRNSFPTTTKSEQVARCPRGTHSIGRNNEIVHVIEKDKSTGNRSKEIIIDSFNQKHGMITASAYKHLRNGCTIDW